MGGRGRNRSEEEPTDHETGGHVNTVRRLGQGAFEDIQEVKPRPSVAPRIPFYDVRCNGVGRLSQLRTEFEAFVRWKGLNCQLVKLDEEIVRTLPRASALPLLPLQPLPSS